MAIKSFTTGEVLTASDTNLYLNNGGLVYITGGSVAAGTILTADSVFTSTYENYRLVITQVQIGTAGRALRLNYRASGAINNTTNYDYAYNGYKASGVTNNAAGTSQTFAEVGVYIDTYANARLGSCSIDIYAPQVATSQTMATSIAQGLEGAIFYRSGGFWQSQVTSFDGFQITLSSTGTMTFNWRLYGYRQA